MLKHFYRKASQQLTQANKSLQRTLDEVKSNTRIAEERLSELSVNVSVLSSISDKSPSCMHPFLLGRYDYRNDSDKCKITYPCPRYF